MPEEMTKAWIQYETGKDYKTNIGLYTTVDTNERFYAGRQWEGIPHVDLPTPVLNVLKRGLALKVAAVADRKLKLKFSVMGQTETEDMMTYVNQINDYCDILWERLKMDYLKDEVLKNAGITGDGIMYFPWNPEVKTGQKVTGDIDVQIIDNVNYYPGNPNDPDVQNQPYIILASRELVKNVRKEAEKNGAKKNEIDMILSDEENEYTAGDMGKYELDDHDKCTVLLKMQKKTFEETVPVKDEAGNPVLDEKGEPLTTKEVHVRVVMEKSTRSATVLKETKTKLTRYPVAMMNWETRKNCCHGTAEITESIPNQVYINKSAALAQVCVMNFGFPKYMYDKTRITEGEMQEKLGVPIPVNGDTAGVVNVIQPGTMSFDVWRGMDTFISQTLDMMGANTALRGDINDPDNTSAFMAVHEAAVKPLQAHQQRLYSFVEDIGLIWLDYMKGYYTNRMIPVKVDAEKLAQMNPNMMMPQGMQQMVYYIPMPDLSKYELTVKIDVGPSAMWSEIQTMQTMDNLLGSGHLRDSEYYERVHKYGFIPDADKLAEKRKQEEAMAAQMAAMMPPTA